MEDREAVADLVDTMVEQLTDIFSGNGLRAVTVRAVREEALALEPQEGAPLEEPVVRLEVVREDVSPPWCHTLPDRLPLRVEALEQLLDSTIAERWEWDLFQAWWQQDFRARRRVVASAAP